MLQLQVSCPNDSVLAKMMCPDISFAIHQCAQFLADPREPYATAQKQLDATENTLDEGIILCKSKEIAKHNCWVDHLPILMVFIPNTSEKPNQCMILC